RARSLSPHDVTDQLIQSNLRGRGGAFFPTGRKASFIPTPDKVAKPIYLTVNADESEPGTFKDREIMLRVPHRLIEGCLIAAHAIQSKDVFIYIRGEYSFEYDVLDSALQEAKAAGVLGQLDMRIHRGACAYSCGEETALLESLEGKRGQPRSRPPFPAVSGLYASPTLINNVQTIATVPAVVAMGGAEYAKIGPENSPGTVVFSRSGNVVNPGNYELELGTPLRELIYDIGGGVADGRELKAIIPGGSSVPILTPDQLDTPLDYESIAAAGSFFGSAAVIVIDDRCCMVQLALRAEKFYMHESCGKCTPCREGTRWMVQLLTKIEEGRAEHGTVTVDGVEVHVPKGLGLVEAALAAGIEIPVFCYEPRLGPPVGACRMCLCDVEGMPKVQTACTMTAQDGMIVRTALTSPK